MVLDTSLLNTQHYKVDIKGKVEQSRERSSALPYISIEKGAFWSTSTTVANVTHLLDRFETYTVTLISYKGITNVVLVRPTLLRVEDECRIFLLLD